MAPMADQADSGSGRRRFEVACSVLSRCVRAEAAAAAGKVVAAAALARSEAQASSSSTMLLIPGADVVAVEERPPATSAQMTIMYGGRVLVFDGVPAGRAAEVMRAAAWQGVSGGEADLQVARKASLQRLLEKRRRDRLSARAPYVPAARQEAAAPKEGREEGDAGSWLELGTPRPRGCAC